MGNVSKKSLTLAKLETFQTLNQQGILTDERLAQAIKDGLEKGEIQQLTPSSFDEKQAELKAFAEKFGLVKEKAEPFGGQHRKGGFEYIKEQHPETVPLFDALDVLIKKSYEVKLEDGTVKILQPMPFCRDITPKPKEATADVTPTETTATV